MAVRLAWTISCSFVRVFYVARARQEQLASLALQQIFAIQIPLIFLRFELPPNFIFQLQRPQTQQFLLILSCSINKVPSIQIWQQFLAISRGFVWEIFYFSYIPMLQTTNLAVLLILSLFCPKCLRVGRSRGPQLQKACRRCHMFGLISLCFPVPFIATGGVKFKKAEHNAALCDVAPTVLDAMGLDVPSEMKGQSLLEK